jgi:hypothetical protein
MTWCAGSIVTVIDAVDCVNQLGRTQVALVEALAAADKKGSGEGGIL